MEAKELQIRLRETKWVGHLATPVPLTEPNPAALYIFPPGGRAYQALIRYATIYTVSDIGINISWKVVI